MRHSIALLSILFAFSLAGCVPPEPQVNDTQILKSALDKVRKYFKVHGEYPLDLDPLPVDSWRNPIRYTQNGDNFELRGFGKDGIEQTCTSRYICGKLELDTIVTNRGWICLCSK